MRDKLVAQVILILEIKVERALSDAGVAYDI